MQAGLALESNLIIFPTGMAADKATRKTRPLIPPVPSLRRRERYGTYAPWLVAGVAIFGLFLGIWYQKAAHDKDFNSRVDGRIDEELKPVNTKLDAISERLAKNEGILETQLRTSQLKAIAALEPNQFAKVLPDLRKITDKSLVGEAAPDRLTLRKIASELRETPETAPDYWPTVLQFIQFSSAGISPHAPPPGKPNLTLSTIVTERRFLFPSVVSHQVVLLEGAKVDNLRFENCRIIFTEKPAHMVKIMFINCVFQMPITATPNQYLKTASHLLLTSNLAEASIPSI